MCWSTLTGQLDMAEKYLALAEKGLADDPEQLGDTLTVKAYIARYRGEIGQAIAQAQRALSLIPLENTWLRSVAAMTLGFAEWGAGNLAGCEEAMQEAEQMAEQSGGLRTFVTALDYRGRVQVLRMRWNQALELFQKATCTAGGKLAGSDIAYADLAGLYYERDHLADAMKAAEQALELSFRSDNVENQAGVYRTLTRIHMAQGNFPIAHETLEKRFVWSKSTTSPTIPPA